MKILLLEPYFGGSHQAFLEGLQQYLPYDFQQLVLPARKWKWRMRLAAPIYAETLWQMNKKPDLVLCSTFMDVATLRGLGPRWLLEVPVYTYFHENQFVYPVQVDDERDFHFALTNLTTALASDRLAFNSTYNLESFLEGARLLLRKTPDMKLPDWEDAIRSKAAILPPGIDFTAIDAAPAVPHNGSVPVIVWNHRWEHDKGPEEFFAALYFLKRQEVDFKLIVLGQSFDRRPAVFDQAREILADRLLHFGYATDKADYYRLLKTGDLVVSTARHEFFGISVVEAVRSGCRPLLPDRLSYQELFPKSCLYRDNGFVDQLARQLDGPGRLSAVDAMAMTEAFSWKRLEPAYRQWFESAAAGRQISRV